MLVSVIIVNYNTKKITTNCIQSIERYTAKVNCEIILVDNASSDGSQEFFRNFKDITFIESSENLGFGRANNLGVKAAKGEFLFFLNSDTLLVENAIEKILRFFILNEEKLKIGVLGCLLVGNDQKLNGFGNTFPTFNGELAKQWRQVPFIKRFIKPDTKRMYNFQKEYFEIDYVIGADMMMRKSLFETMNGFYPGFFMYFEETDLQIRIFESGFKNYIFTKTKIIHLEEASGNAIINYSNKKRIITHKSRVLYLKRNESKRFYKFVIADFLFLILNFVNFKYTFRENSQYFIKIVKSYFKN